MKSLIKRPLKAVWRWTHPLRRPVLRKVEAFLARTYAQAVPSPHVHVACNCRVNEDTSVLMDFLVRELVHLQDQVESLRETVADMSQEGRGLTVVNGPDALEHARSAAG